MEGVEERHRPVPPGVPPRQLQRRLDRLGPAVGEEDPLRARARAPARPAARPAGPAACSRSRSPTCGSAARLCRRIAATTRGWQCPTFVTAIPAVKSRKRLPSRSSIIAPLRPADDQRIDPRVRRRHHAIVALEPGGGPRAGQRAEDPGFVAMKRSHPSSLCVGTRSIRRDDGIERRMAIDQITADRTVAIPAQRCERPRRGDARSWANAVFDRGHAWRPGSYGRGSGAA